MEVEEVLSEMVIKMVLVEVEVTAQQEVMEQEIQVIRV